MPRKTWLLIFVSLFGISITSLGQSPTSKAVKFDEFGDIYSSDLKARLDNYAIQMQQQPTTKGFLMIYRSRRDIPGLNMSLGLRMQDYLVQTRGLPKSRVVIVDAGVADCLVQELWIVHPNTAPSPREDAKIGYVNNPDVAWRFLEYGFLPPEELFRFNMESQNGIHDELLGAFAAEVKKQRGNSACVIVYAQYNPKGMLVDYTGEYEPIPDIKLDRPGTAQKRLVRESTVLTKTMGLSPSRVKTIDGGYRKRRAVELWVVPQGEPLPVPTPNSYPKGWKGRSR